MNMLTAFLSYPYDDYSTQFVESLRPLLEAIDISVLDGRYPNAADQLSVEITNRIKSCEILVCVISEAHPSNWVQQEIGVAYGANLDIIAITDGVVVPAGLIQCQYHISRNDGDALVCGQLASSIREIKMKRAVSLGTFSATPSEDELKTDDWSLEIEERVKEVWGKFAEAKIQSALDLASQYYKDHPDCWRFGISKSSALIHLNRFEEAERVLNGMVRKFKKISRALSYAYENKGWLISQARSGFSEASLEEEMAQYELALKHEKRVKIYFNLIQCLLELNRIDDAESKFAECLSQFPGALGELKRQASIQGPEFSQEIAKSRLLFPLLSQL